MRAKNKTEFGIILVEKIDIPKAPRSAESCEAGINDEYYGTLS